MSEPIVLAVLATSAALGGSVIGPAVQRLLSRRGDDAKAEVDEATADVTIAGAWQEYAAGLRADLDAVRTRMQIEGDNMRARITGLEAEVGELKDSLTEANNRVQIQASLLRSVCRWALLLRDELLKVGGHVPPMPPDVEAAITTLDP